MTMVPEDQSEVTEKMGNEALKEVKKLTQKDRIINSE
jgi:hypothetical protein